MHPAPVMRMLVKEPVAADGVAGEDVVQVETLHDAGAVARQVHHQASEFGSLVQADIERAGVLVWTGNDWVTFFFWYQRSNETIGTRWI